MALWRPPCWIQHGRECGGRWPRRPKDGRVINWVTMETAADQTKPSFSLSGILRRQRCRPSSAAVVNKTASPHFSNWSHSWNKTEIKLKQNGVLFRHSRARSKTLKQNVEISARGKTFRQFQTCWTLCCFISVSFQFRFSCSTAISRSSLLGSSVAAATILY